MALKASTAPSPQIRPNEPVPEPPQRKTLALGLIATVAILGGGAYAGYEAWQRSLAEQARTTQATAPVAPLRKGVVIRKARIDGVTVSKNFVNVIAPRLQMPENGRPMVILKLAPAGSRVKKGDVVMELDPQSLLDHIDDVKDRVHETENAVKRKQVELELAKENLQQRIRVAKGTLDKALLDLKTLEVRSAIQQNLMKLAANEARENLNRLEAELKMLESSQEADLRGVEITRTIERLHLKRHESDLVKFTLRSPVDGLVVLKSMHRHGGDQVTVAAGDIITPGQPILQIVDTSDMLVEAQVNQAVSNQYKIGQNASVGFDAYPGSIFPAKLTAVGALATLPGRREQFYIRTIPVKLKLEEVDDRVLPDLTAFAEIELDRAEDVVVAPASAIVHEADKHFVYVKEGAQFEKREVTIGLASNTEVAILEGASEGERIRLSN